MRKTRVLFLLFCLVAGAYVALYGLKSGWFDESAVRDQKNIAQPAAPAPESSRRADAPPARNEKAEIIRPIFDVVRAEPSGEMLMAGQAEPGWTVTVRSGEKAIGSAVADADGNWIIQPQAPIAKGDHSLELRAQEPDSKRTVFSKQRLALSLAPNITNQPLVAVTEEGKATRVLQGPLQGPGANQSAAGQTAAAGNAAEQQAQSQAATAVSFISVDYEELGEKSVIHLSGYGTPGSSINLFMDNEPLGTAKADATGSWTFSANRQLTDPAYDLRADLTGGASQKVIARAEVKFDRQPSAEVALGGDDLDEKARAWREWDKEADANATGVAADGGFNPENAEENVIIVRSGDTLWQIAQRHYGNGRKFTQIFRSNREQIRNPNLIYPSQKLYVPKD